MGQEQIIFVQSCGDGREVRFAISWPMMARLDCNEKLRAVIYGRRFAMNFDYYSRPIAMSDPGRHAALFEGLPRDAGALAKIVQGLLVHQHIAPAYGLTLTRNQQAQSHVRAVEKILDGIVMRDGRPLSALRAINERQVGVCRHFTLLHVAMLRTRGIPARARCGFGGLFRKGQIPRSLGN